MPFVTFSSVGIKLGIFQKLNGVCAGNFKNSSSCGHIYGVEWWDLKVVLKALYLHEVKNFGFPLFIMCYWYPRESSQNYYLLLTLFCSLWIWWILQRAFFLTGLLSIWFYLLCARRRSSFLFKRVLSALYFWERFIFAQQDRYNSSWNWRSVQVQFSGTSTFLRNISLKISWYTF